MILIINDDESMQELLADTINNYGINCVCASNGEQALKIISENITLIICDYDMPSMDGKEFRNIQRKKFPGIPFILVCGQVYIENLAKQLQADHFVDISKFSRCEFQNSIKESILSLYNKKAKQH